VRSGAILPIQPLVQNTGEKPDGPLALRVYLPAEGASGDCRGSLYQDDGHTFAYAKGEILRVDYSCRVAANSITVTSSVTKNAFQPWWTSAEVTVYGVAAEPKEIRVGDLVIHETRYDSKSHSVTLTVPDAVRNWTVRLVL